MATTRKVDKRLGRTVRLLGFAAAALGITMAALVILAGWGLNYVAAALVGAAFLWGLVSTILIARYRCPECKRRIGTVAPNPQSPPGRAIVFACKQCDVEWDTTLTRISRSSTTAG